MSKDSPEQNYYADGITAVPQTTNQLDGETLAEWIARCGMECVERTLEAERQKYGVR